MYFFSSDLHFGDFENLKVDNRPFKSLKKFHSYVIRTWNKQAKKNDTIFVIGDFIDCDGKDNDTFKETLTYVKKIKANVVLIMGNNEDRVVKYFFDNDFDKFKDYCLSLGYKGVYKSLDISFQNKDFYLVHKPINCIKGKINLFGHVHRSGGLYAPYGINVGCDLNHFRLYDENDIFKFLDMKQRYWDNDKNLNLKWKNL